MTRFNLSPQTEITDTIIRWDAPKLLENPPLIEITGYASVDPTIPEGPERHRLLSVSSATVTLHCSRILLARRHSPQSHILIFA